MAPGASTPKGTGTVPKSKSQNNSLPREMVAPIRRDMQFNQDTNNLASLDWQNLSGSGSQVNLQNIVYPLVDYYDLDSSVTYDNNRYLSVRPQPRTHSSPQHEEDLYHNNCLSLNSSCNMSSNTAIVMPTTGGAPQHHDASASQRGEPTLNRNTAFKVNNISQVVPPDRTELKQKLHQIREYLRVTSSLISSVNDGETSAREIASPMSQNSGSSGSLAPQNAVDPRTMRDGIKPHHVVQDQQSSLSAVGSEFRTSEERNINENVANQTSDNPRNGVASIEQFEASVTQLQERLGNLRQEGVGYSTAGVEQMNRNLQSLHDRLSHLQDLSDGRVELARVLGERDDELSTEHCALQEKLKELHMKKQQMEKLVSDLQNLTTIQTERQNVNSLQDQLSHLQGMMDVVRRTEAELNETSSSTPESNRTMSQSSNINWCIVNKSDINEMRGRNCNVYQSTDSGIDNREQENFTNRKPKKKSNTMEPIERQQMLLKEELNAKKRQLEELMRKDQVQTSMINQDNYSEASMDKSDVSHYECRGEQPEMQWINTPSADMSGLRCDNVHSSDGWHDLSTNLNQTGSNVQLNNRTSRPSNRESRSPSSTKRVQDLHTTVLSNVASQTAPVGSVGSGSHVSMPHVWRKPSQDAMSSVSGPTSAMRSGWNPSWTSPASRHDQNSSVSINSFLPLPSVANRQVAQGSQEWWQKKALQLQQQLELTSNLCQSMIIEQQRATTSPPVNVHNLYPVYPPSVSTQLVLPTVGAAGESPQCAGFAAASHLHIQTMILTSLNQCCQLLWLQQRELSNLRSSVSSLHDRSEKQDLMPAMPSVLNASHTIHPYAQMNGPPHQAKISTTPSMVAQQQPTDACFDMSYTFPTQSVNVPINNHLNAPQPPSAQHYNNTAAPPTHSYDNNLTYARNAVQTASNATASIQNMMFGVAHQQNNVVPAGALQNFNNMCGGAGGGMTFNNQNVAQNSISNSVQTTQNETQRPPPPQVNWPGVQALNNQVPPGNRANNYWDNFRSYSRQNLLSTSSKSNEGSSHSPSPLIDRSHNTLRSLAASGAVDPTSQAPHNATVPKLNTTNPLDDKKIGRRKKSPFVQSVFNTHQHHHPDVVNINQHGPTAAVENVAHDAHGGGGAPDTNTLSSNFTFNDTQCHGAATGLHPPSNLNLNVENGTRLQSLVPAFACPRAASNKCAKVSSRKTNDRNEWIDNGQNNSNDSPNTKLFDMLRENVYKEVASLISANENRPHFLIQLFRDLQLISSDGLRQRTLQSIQDVVTSSLSSLSNSGQGANRQNMSFDESKRSSDTDAKETDARSKDNEKSEKNAQSTGVGADDRWNEFLTPNKEKLDGEIRAMLMNLRPLLKPNYSNTFNDSLLVTIRSLLIQLIPTIQSFRENNQKLQEYFSMYEGHLNCLLDDVLNKYKNYRVQDKIERVIAELGKVLLEELHFVLHGNTENGIESDNLFRFGPTAAAAAAAVHKKQPDQAGVESSEAAAQTYGPRAADAQPTQNNGDLAEADQSHHVDEDEGAVGGVLNEAAKGGNNCTSTQDHQSERTVNAEADSEWLTFEAGLDCVPSRLNDSNNADNSNMSPDTSQEQIE